MQRDNYEWLDIISSNSDHPVLNMYRKDNELFFNDYVIIDDEEFLIIGNKKNNAIYEFAKIDDSFIYEPNTEQKRTIFKFKNLELVKKELV